MKIVLTSVLVDDQEKALRFYRDIWFQLKHDISLGVHRCLRSSPPMQPDGVELVSGAGRHRAAKPLKSVLSPTEFPARRWRSRMLGREHAGRRSLRQFTQPSVDDGSRDDGSLRGHLRQSPADRAASLRLGAASPFAASRMAAFAARLVIGSRCMAATAAWAGRSPAWRGVVRSAPSTRRASAGPPSDRPVAQARGCFDRHGEHQLRHVGVRALHLGDALLASSKKSAIRGARAPSCDRVVGGTLGLRPGLLACPHGDAVEHAAAGGFEPAMRPVRGRGRRMKGRVFHPGHRDRRR